MFLHCGTLKASFIFCKIMKILVDNSIDGMNVQPKVALLRLII